MVQRPIEWGFYFWPSLGFGLAMWRGGAKRQTEAALPPKGRAVLRAPQRSAAALLRRPLKKRMIKRLKIRETYDQKPKYYS